MLWYRQVGRPLSSLFAVPNVEFDSGRIAHLVLVLICRLGVLRVRALHATTTLRLLLSHYYRRSTSCLFCGRSHLPKGHSKGPDAVGGAKAIRSVLFFISAASIHPLTAVRPGRFAIHAGHSSYQLAARTRPRTSAPPCSRISGVLKDLFRKDTPSNFVISLFTHQLHAIFIGSFLSKTTAITRPIPSGRPCDKQSTQTAYRIARPTYHRRPRSQSRQVW